MAILGVDFSDVAAAAYGADADGWLEAAWKLRTFKGVSS